MKRFSITDVCLSILTLAIVCVALAPALARVQRTWQEAACQSNLQRWAEAMELYTVDNSGCYPTNRIIQPNGTLSIVMAEANLSRQEVDPSTGNPYRFEYSINWVEALYPYLWARAEKTGQDWKSWMRCPNASSICRPSDSTWNCAVNYAFNATLAEYGRGIVKNPEKLMMLRELAWTEPAVLRPTNPAARGSSAPANAPKYAFLNSKDPTTPAGQVENGDLHGGGSYIVCADGHVKHFTIEFYPLYTSTWATSAYDTETNQWYNYVYGRPRNPTQAMLNKTIAITP